MTKTHIHLVLNPSVSDIKLSIDQLTCRGCGGVTGIALNNSAFAYSATIIIKLNFYSMEISKPLFKKNFNLLEIRHKGHTFTKSGQTSILYYLFCVLLFGLLNSDRSVLLVYELTYSQRTPQKLQGVLG